MSGQEEDGDAAGGDHLHQARGVAGVVSHPVWGVCDESQECVGSVSAARAGRVCAAAERSSPWRVHAGRRTAVER